jgi:hypothetical protein
MSYETERQTITTLFKTAWEAGSNYPVQWPNQEFTPPSDGSPYVAFNILRGQSRAASLNSSGSARYRHPGIVQIDVIFSRGKGVRLANETADEIAAIFRGKTLSGIRYQAPDVREVSEPETSRVRFNVSVPFTRDTTF